MIRIKHQDSVGGFAHTKNNNVEIIIYEGTYEAVRRGETAINPRSTEIIKCRTIDENIGSAATHEGIHATDDEFSDGKRENRARSVQRKYDKEVEMKRVILKTDFKFQQPKLK